MPLDVGVRQVLEEVLEVLERVQAVGLGSLDDTVDGGAGLGSFRGVAEQPILAADGEVADGALADVVRERSIAAFRKAWRASLWLREYWTALLSLDFGRTYFLILPNFSARALMHSCETIIPQGGGGVYTLYYLALT